MNGFLDEVIRPERYENGRLSRADEVPQAAFKTALRIGINVQCVLLLITSKFARCALQQITAWAEPC